MTEKPVKVPDQSHPITIRPAGRRVVVVAAGKVVADSRAALVLQEAAYPPVFYVPRADADMAMLVRTDHTTYCPYKGDSSYYSIPAGGERSANAVWSYEAPFPAVAAIEGHLAFYPDRVDSIGERSDADLLPASAVPQTAG